MADYVQKPEILIKQKSNAITSYVDIVKHINGFTIIETYPGVRVDEIINGLVNNGFNGKVIKSEDFSDLSAEEFRNAILDDLTEDRVFGKLSEKNYEDFFDKKKIHDFVENSSNNQVLVIGICAHLFNFANAKLIYADMPRWELQLRYRNKEGVYFKGALENETLKNFKRGYFIEWRMADRIKKYLWNQIDSFLDTTIANSPKMITKKIMDDSIISASHRPFRLVPYFDAGVWGGDWMKNNLGLGENKHSKWAWGFDGVPEENSIIFKYDDGITIEIPAINVVFFASKDLLGDRVWNRFGEEFPIRFDFLDTINGQNLSLQVHPTTQYIKDKFRMSYTQEESYYILDVDPNSNPTCYLGLKDGVNKDEFFDALKNAQKTNQLDVEKYVNRFSVKKHDHLHHPAGCIHSSASGCMVLEISATPYIFTFKLWDWGRVDFDGKPRPINIEHGKNVLQSQFNTTKCEKECFSPISVLTNENGYKLERTGLHETQFIETRRHFVDKEEGVIVECHSSVNMANLVEGTNVVVESLNNEFESLIIHYAETFIVPESCKKYRVRSLNKKPFVLLQSFVRTNA